MKSSLKQIKRRLSSLKLSKSFIVLFLLLLIAFITAFQISQKQTVTQKTRAKQRQKVIREDEERTGLPEEDIKEPEYAPGEIIIKLKEKSSNILDKKLARSPRFEEVSIGIDSLDEIPTEYKLTVKKITPVFKIIKQKQLKDGLSFQDQVQEIKNEFPERSKRADKDSPVPDLSRIYKITFKEKDVDILSLCQRYQEDQENVEYAEPNYLTTTFYVPNDPRYTEQWAHQNTNAALGWDIERGNSDRTIAIVDTGIDYNHEDLAANIWQDEQSNPGKDFVDIDTERYKNNGYQLVTGEDYTEVDDDPSDYNGHGTHCAGIAGAVGNNNVGVVGVCHGCRVMPVRAGFSIIHPTYGEVGLLENDDIANAINYATNSGADIVSMSFGGDRPSQLQKDIINYAFSNGVVLIGAAGNSDENEKIYPAAYENVIAVVATAQDDSKALYSNYGYWVDVAAPGGDRSKDTMILSTVPKIGTLGDSSGYRFLQGTSMACPYVAGLVGLVLSSHPEFIQEEIRSILRSTSDSVGIEGFDKYTGYGRVNVKAALKVDRPCVALIHSPESGTYLSEPESITIKGTASGRFFESYTLEVGKGNSPINWTTINSDNILVDNGVLGNWNTSGIGGTFTLRLTVSNLNQEKFQAYSHVGIIQDVHEGWPKEFGFYTKPAVIGDLDGDGLQDLIFTVAPFGNLVFAVDHNGKNLPGLWPVESNDLSEGGAPETNSVAGDINGDGNLEVVFGTFYSFIYALRGDGTTVPGWPQGVTEMKSWPHDPMLVDLDGNGVDEVVAGFVTAIEDTQFAGEIHVWYGNGKPMPGWPQSLPLVEKEGRMHISYAAGDMNGDGRPEIAVIQTVRKGDTSCMVFNSSGRMLFDPIKLPHGEYVSEQNSPILGDVTGDGLPELIFNTEGTLQRIHVLQHNGTYPPGSEWPIDIGGRLSLGDLNFDGSTEVLVATGNRILVFQGNGHLLHEWSLDQGVNFVTVPLVGDVDGDGYPDIVAATHGEVYALDQDGEIIPGWPKTFAGNSNYCSPTIGDVDGDSMLELLVGGGVESQLFLYDLEGSTDPLTLQWPMFQHDSKHTGYYHTPPTSDLKDWSDKSCSSISDFKDIYSKYGWGQDSADTRFGTEFDYESNPQENDGDDGVTLNGESLEGKSLVRGNSYTLMAVSNTNYNPPQSNAKAWVDWDGPGGNPPQLIMDYSYPYVMFDNTPMPVEPFLNSNKKITVPYFAKDKVCFRFINTYYITNVYGYNDNTHSGEVEDYVVNIVNPPPSPTPTIIGMNDNLKQVVRFPTAKLVDRFFRQ
jgi:thermitase